MREAQRHSPVNGRWGALGPITISAYQKFDWLREPLKKDGVNIALPTVN